MDISLLAGWVIHARDLVKAIPSKNSGPPAFQAQHGKDGASRHAYSAVFLSCFRNCIKYSIEMCDWRTVFLMHRAQVV